MSDDKNKDGHKERVWPKADKLKEAVDRIYNFRLLCQYQMEVGYWATVDFPTRHHINKILALQYSDRDVLERVYGKKLMLQALELVPYCKGYLEFTKGQVAKDVVPIKNKKKVKNK